MPLVGERDKISGIGFKKTEMDKTHDDLMTVSSLIRVLAEQQIVNC
jgi:hypothetical protein